MPGVPAVSSPCWGRASHALPLCCGEEQNCFCRGRKVKGVTGLVISLFLEGKLRGGPDVTKPTSSKWLERDEGIDPAVLWAARLRSLRAGRGDH